MSFTEEDDNAEVLAERDPFDYQTVKNWQFEPLTESYTRSDVVKYARGIGVGMPGPCPEGEEVFLSESDDLQALPMMAIILNQGPMWTQDPRTGIDWTMTVHAEESVTLHRPLPNEGTLVAEYRVDELFDKGAGKGALMYESRQLSLASGEPVATVKIATFLRGNGGFGGSREAAPRPPRVPADRPADATVELATPGRDNTTYQLGSEFVEAVKSDLLVSDKPMLRGVCSFGLAGRAVLKLACDNVPARLKHLSLRYIAPVFAEETLRAELWFLEPGRAAFRVSSVDREAVVMDNGVAEFEASATPV
jgi:2-enoyl-CoA hydratase-like protein/MaoC dehydratase-like protein